MKDPAVLFYTQDFITGTILMTDEQRGKYIMLLCLQHQNGKLTEKDMLKICGEKDEDIWCKFYQEDGYFYNKRMVIETNKRNNYTESRRKNLKKSVHMDPHMDPHMENENEDVNKDIIVIDKEIENLYNEVVIFFDENCRPKTEKQKQDWCDTLDKLIRIDGHKPEHIKNIIKRTRIDDFWKTNFLSILKLRKKDPQQIMYFTVFEKKTFNNNKGIKDTDY
jgi:hypothetical protein